MLINVMLIIGITDYARLITPRSLNGVNLQQVLALSSVERGCLKAALLSSITGLVNADRGRGVSQLQELLAPFNMTYEFYPGRDTLPPRIRSASLAEIKRFAGNTENPAAEGLAAILWSDIEGNGSAQKAMMYRFVETLLELITLAPGGERRVFALHF